MTAATTDRVAIEGASTTLTQNVSIFQYSGTAELWVLAPWLVGTASLLAGVSSLLTVGRYLRV